jgi:hypothetical protein
MSFQLSGNTRSVPLPVVLQNLQQAKVTGTLSIRLSAIEKCVHFKNGQIIFATSNDGQDRLGEMLVKAGYLTRENLETALALYRKNAGLKKIGAILVENGFVSPKNLFAGLKAQVKDILYSLFLWEDVEYHFEENLAADIIQLQINLQELISEIIDRMKKESE